MEGRHGMKRGRRVVVGITALGILLAMSFAGTALAQSASTSSSASGSAGSVDFVEGTTNDISTVNPWNALETPEYEVLSLNFDLLLNFDKANLAASPGLASAWTTSPDGLTWTFTIRSDATWQDGQPVTAKDVAYTYNTTLDCKLGNSLDYLVPDYTKSISAPNEIYASDVAGSGCPAKTGDVDPGKENCSLNQGRAITRVNNLLLSKIDMQKIESFWFTGAENAEVEGFLVKPPNFDPSKKYPVEFLIHGGPQGAWGDDWSYRWNAELFAANGYVVIMINFHGSTGYGQKFIDAINGDWGGALFEDLMKGLDYAEQHYPFIDKDRECALGASYGGYMANWILGHTNRFKCIVAHDGMFNTESAWGTTEELWFNEWEFKGTPYTNRELYGKWSPHLSATSFKTPTLVVHGQLDYRLDVSEGFQLFTTLQRLNVPTKMLYFPDEGHWVLKPQNSRLWYQTVNAWVDQWTKK